MSVTVYNFRIGYDADCVTMDGCGGVPRSDSFFVMKRSDSFLNMGGSPMFRFDEVGGGGKHASVAAFKQPRSKLPLGKQAHKQLQQEQGGDLLFGGLMDPLGGHPPASPAVSLGALLGTPATELSSCKADAPANRRLKAEPDATQHLTGPLGARQPPSSDAAGSRILSGRGHHKVGGRGRLRGCCGTHLPCQTPCLPCLPACPACPAV